MDALMSENLGSVAQQERRGRILDATIALASKGGFDAVQMRAVAERAGVALGTLYRYFPSKIHLLVSALVREFERAEDGYSHKAIPGDTPQQRVTYVLRRATRSLQREPHLTEALTRAFMFADKSVAAEIHSVSKHVVRMLSQAMREQGADATEPTQDDLAIARVIGDVWLASLVRGVTGRSSSTDVGTSLDLAVRLLLR